LRRQHLVLVAATLTDALVDDDRLETFDEVRLDTIENDRCDATVARDTERSRQWCLFMIGESVMRYQADIDRDRDRSNLEYGTKGLELLIAHEIETLSTNGQYLGCATPHRCR